MKMKAEILAENIVKGSGSHGLKKEQLTKIFSAIDNLEDFAYTIKKVFEHGGKDYLTTQIFSHAVPNTLLPIITILGFNFSWLLAGSVLT